MKRTALAILVAAAVPLATPVPAAELMSTEYTISTDAAMQIAGAALAACRKENQNVSVTVVDHAGRVKAQIRDDRAAPHTMEHSMRKAYTALSYRMPSAEYGKRAAEAKGVAIGPQLLPNITTAAGGVPIKIGTHVVGAVGVSGTPSSAGGGEGDAKCAQQAITDVLKD